MTNTQSDSFFNLSLDLLCVAGFDGYFKELNPAWEKTLGWSIDELRSQSLFAFVHPDDHESTRTCGADLISTGKLITYENRYRHKNGSYVTLAWNATVSDENLIFGIARDITKLKAAEEEKKLLDKRLRLALSTIKMGVWDWDVTNDILVWDESLYEIYGLKKEDFSGAVDAWEKTIHPEDKIKAKQDLMDALDGKRPFDMTFRAVLPNGKVRFIGAKGSVERDESGRPIKMMGLNWDKTREYEQDLLIKEQQAKIISSAKMSSLGEMASGIAHEINNPLSIIQGKATLLKKRIQEKEKNNEEILKDLEKIDMTSNRIVKIIKGLRYFSRNAEGDPFMPAEARHILDDTLELCREKFKNQNIDLIVNDEVDGYLECRPVQISQVLLNLLNNSYDAVKANKQAWIKIDIEKKDDRFYLSVMDSGNGISGEIEEKIMQPFFTTKEVGHGTGLGLSIAKGIVEDHGGQLWHDKTSKNTRFVMELPRKQNRERRLH